MRKFKSNRIITNKIWFCLMSFCLFISKAKTQDSTAYPLDPLNADEIKKVVLILKNNKAIRGASFFDEGTEGMTEAVVDLNTEKVVSIKRIPNVIGMGLEADSLVASDILKN